MSLISPVGIEACLAVIGLGATMGSELDNILMERFGDTHEMVKCLNDVTDLNKFPEIKSKTAVIFDKTSQPSAVMYNQLIKHVELASADFIHDPDDADHHISKFIMENTGLDIKVWSTERTRVIIINVLWFKDVWVTKFDSKLTRVAPFHSSTGTIQVNMMSQTGRMLYYEHEDLIGVSLPFVNGATAEFMSGLPYDSQFNQSYRYVNENVELYLPKFHCSANNNLIDTLSSVGINGLLHGNNMEGLITNRNVMVDKFRQIIHVTFDEEGIEDKVPSKFDQTKKHKRIRFDRPFHYRIMKNGLVLVSGYYDGY